MYLYLKQISVFIVFATFLQPLFGQKITDGLVAYWSFDESASTYLNGTMEVGRGGYEEPLSRSTQAIKGYLHPNQKQETYLLADDGVKAKYLKGVVTRGWFPGIWIDFEKDFSISLFAKAKSGSGTVFSKYSANKPGDVVLSLKLTGDAQKIIEVNVQGKKFTFPAGHVATEGRAWAHIAVVKSGSELAVFFNQREIGKVPDFFPKDSKRNELEMFDFSGGMDELYFFSRALAPDEVIGLSSDGIGWIRGSLADEIRNRLNREGNADKLLAGLRKYQSDERFHLLNLDQYSFKVPEQLPGQQTTNALIAEFDTYYFVSEKQRDYIKDLARDAHSRTILNKQWQNVIESDFSTAAIAELQVAVSDNIEYIRLEWHLKRMQVFLDRLMDFIPLSEEIVNYDTQPFLDKLKSTPDFFSMLRDKNTYSTITREFEEFEAIRENAQVIKSHTVSAIEYDGAYIVYEDNLLFLKEMKAKNYHYGFVRWKASSYPLRYFVQEDYFLPTSSFKEIILTGGIFNENSISDLLIAPVEEITLDRSFFWSPTEEVRSGKVWSPQRENGASLYNSLKFRTTKIADNRYKIELTEDLDAGQRYIILNGNFAYGFMPQDNIQLGRNSVVLSQEPSWNGLFLQKTPSGFVELPEKRLRSGVYRYNTITNGYAPRSLSVFFYSSEDVGSAHIPSLSGQEPIKLRLNTPKNPMGLKVYQLEKRELKKTKMLNAILKDIIKGDGVQQEEGVFYQATPFDLRFLSKTLQDNTFELTPSKSLDDGLYVFQLEDKNWLIRIGEFHE